MQVLDVVVAVVVGVDFEVGVVVVLELYRLSPLLQHFRMQPHPHLRGRIRNRLSLPFQWGAHYTSTSIKGKLYIIERL